jgi:hypothetical protein
VGDAHDGHPLGVEGEEELEDLGARLRVQVPGGLVGEEQRGLRDERPGDRHPLLLSAGELVRRVVEARAQPDALEHRPGPRRPLRARDAALVDERELDVLEGGRAREEVEPLEHEPDRLVPERRAAVGVEGRHVASADPARAARGPVQAADEVHEGRLAGARGADDRHGLAALDAQVDAAERVDRALPSP